MKSDERLIYSSYYAFFINGITALVFGAILPDILNTFNIGYNTGGIFLSMQSIGNLVASVISGMIIVKIGLKKASVILTSATFFGFLLLPISSNIKILALAFILTGFGRGSISNISNTIVSNISNGDAGKLNILHTFFAVGAFLIPFVVTMMYKMGYDWKVVIFCVTFLAFIMVVNFSLLDTKNISIKEKVDSGKTLEFFRKPSFYTAAGILFFYVGVEYAINGWIVTYLQDTNLMSANMAKIMLSVMWIIIIFGRLFTAYMSKKMKKENILVISSIGCLIFFGMFLISDSIIPILITVLGLGFCLAGIFPTTIANVAYLINNSSLAMGVLLGIGGIGGVLMPLITGIVADQYGIFGGMVVISIAAILLVVFAVLNKIIKVTNR